MVQWCFIIVNLHVNDFNRCPWTINKIDNFTLANSFYDAFDEQFTIVNMVVMGQCTEDIQLIKLLKQ